MRPLKRELAMVYNDEYGQIELLHEPRVAVPIFLMAGCQFASHNIKSQTSVKWIARAIIPNTGTNMPEKPILKLKFKTTERDKESLSKEKQFIS